MFPPCLRLPAIILGLFGCGCSAIEPGAAKNNIESPPERAAQSLRDAQASTRDDVVAVLTSVQGADSWCTGIVIESGLVLTAEHCLGPALPPDVQVDCATATLPAISPQSTAWVVSGDNVKAVATTAYASIQNVRLPAAAGRLCGDDIALLELARPLSGVAEAIVTASHPEAGASFTAVGYGSDGINSGFQRENTAAKLNCIGTQCVDTRIAPSELLAHSGACEGDSGSPAFDAEGRAFAMAVRSSSDCSETAYLQLAGYASWIASNAIDVANAQNRSAPRWALDALASADAGSLGADASVANTATQERRLHAYGGGCSVAPGSHPSGACVEFLLAILVAFGLLGTATRKRIV